MCKLLEIVRTTVPNVTGIQGEVQEKCYVDKHAHAIVSDTLADVCIILVSASKGLEVSIQA